MNLLQKAFGIYQTNCYILQTNIGDFIIDPGMDSTGWVVESTKHPIAILNTHGHFDHIWCNYELKAKFDILLLCPKEDCFMLESDCFNLNLNPYPADIKVENNQIFYFNKNGLIKDDEKDLESKSEVESNSKTASTKSNMIESSEIIEVEFMFFPGHTPGCSMIKIGDFIFSGDFIFKRSIGRSDFPYSNKEDMIASLKKFKNIPYNMALYPGHGESTTIKEEQKIIDTWIKTIC